MRRAAALSAVALGLVLAAQTTATAGILGKDDCDGRFFPSVWRSQPCGCDGIRNYVLRNLGLCHPPCVCKPCPPPAPPAPTYIHVTRSPRDFWMLH